MRALSRGSDDSAADPLGGRGQYRGLHGRKRRGDRRQPRPARHAQTHELIAVILLSLVAVLTAWCGFESNKWGGDSSVAFSEASAARIEAADYESQARDARGFDLAVYTQWVVPARTARPTLAEYIQERFSPELAVAFDAWQADGSRSAARSRWRSTCRRARRRRRTPRTGRTHAGQGAGLQREGRQLLAHDRDVRPRAVPGRDRPARRSRCWRRGSCSGSPARSHSSGSIVLFTFPVRV